MQYTEGFLVDLVRDVAPKVEALTGWNANLDSLTVKRVNREDLWPAWNDTFSLPRSMQGILRLLFDKLFFVPRIPAMYSIKTKTMYIAPENYSDTTTVYGIARVIGHELTHHAQFTNNPEFTQQFLRYANGSRFLCSYVSALPTEVDERHYQNNMLLEGDAVLVEGLLREHYPGSWSTAPWPKPGKLLDRCFRTQVPYHGIRKKWYREGFNRVYQVYEAQGRAAVNELYLHPEQLPPIDSSKTIREELQLLIKRQKNIEERFPDLSLGKLLDMI